jgi:copper(I)-binding protein
MAIRSVVLGILGVAAAALSACQPGGRTPGDISVRSAWARATAPGQEAGGAFLIIRGRGAPDRLVGGSTPVAASVEIHTMHMDGAIMRMRRQNGVDVPADGALKLEPGGTHLMLMGLRAPLAAGRTFDLALDFAEAGRKEVRVKVLPIAATGPRDGSDE